MLNTIVIKELLKAYWEHESCIIWFKSRIKTAPRGESISKIKKLLYQEIDSKEVTRKILDQYYIHGITLQKLYDDANINR